MPKTNENCKIESDMNSQILKKMRKIFEILEKQRVIDSIAAIKEAEPYTMNLTDLCIASKSHATVLQKDMKKLIELNLVYVRKEQTQVGQPVYYALNIEKYEKIGKLVQEISENAL